MAINVPDRVWIVLDKISFGLTQDLYIGIWYVPPINVLMCMVVSYPVAMHFWKLKL